MLKGYTNQSGYLRIDIRKYGKRYSILIHRLVAAAFLQMPPSMDYQLHHKDFNKSNNASDNLEWIKPSDHAEKHRIHNIKENKMNVCTKSEENSNRTHK